MKNTDEQIEQKLNLSNARRKFLVKGTATALIASVPVKVSWAQSANGCMVSGTLSGNQSTTTCNATASGYSPSYWGDDSSSSLSGSSLNETWSQVFSGSPQNTNVTGSSSLLNVLISGDEIDRHLIAGYLNAASGFYPLSQGVSAKNYAAFLQEEAMSNPNGLIAALEQTYTLG